jgi:MFS family permease
VTLTPYRHVLAVPGISRLLLVATLARIPTTAAGVVLTLHVVVGLDRGYGAAGIVTAAYTIGAALGGPWRGRAVDRYGVRAALWPSVIVEAAFWSASPWLPYELLLPGAVVVGLFALPVFSLTRQAIGVMVPEHLRRTAFALDSITVEMSFMAGPMLGALVVTTVSSTAALIGVGALQAVAGLVLVVFNPSVRSAGAGTSAGRRREWFTRRFVAVILLMAASTLALAGTDVATVAVLNDQGHTHLVGLVLATWGFGSMVGGFVYGAMSRAVSSATLVIGLGLVTIPLGLAHSWWVLALALIPAGALCAPSISATVGEVSRLVPEAQRGEAMGWHSTAATMGVAAGAPLTGAAIDHLGPGWGFAMAGAAGTLLALVALALGRTGSAAGSVTPAAEPAPAESGTGVAGAVTPLAVTPLAVAPLAVAPLAGLAGAVDPVPGVTRS